MLNIKTQTIDFKEKIFLINKGFSEINNKTRVLTQAFKRQFSKKVIYLLFNKVVWY